MATYSIKDIIHSTDRHKLYTLICSLDELPQCIAYVQAEQINALNIGKELAKFIDGIKDYSYLTIDVYDYAVKLLEKSKSKPSDPGNPVLAVYNLGILMEPRLELNAVQLLKEFSKSAALIIIWEYQSMLPERLFWPTQQNNVFLDFAEAQIKKLQYAI